MPILIKRGQYPTLPSDTEFTQLPRPRKPIPETRREKAPLVAEAGRDEIQASSVKLQVQAGGAQSWWGGLCGEVTWKPNHHGSLEVEVTTGTFHPVLPQLQDGR